MGGAGGMQQNGGLEGVLASLSAPGSSAALREGASTLLLHVSSGRAGMAIFERSEVTEAFSEALLECGDCTVRATLVAVLAKLAANSDSPSERSKIAMPARPELTCRRRVLAPSLRAADDPGALRLASTPSSPPFCCMPPAPPM